MSTPNCPLKDTQNHLMFVYPFYGLGTTHPAFDLGVNAMMDYTKGMKLDYSLREPWHMTVYPEPNDHPDTLGTSTYKVQVPDLRTRPRPAPTTIQGPALTPEELKRRDDEWRKKILDANLAEEKRTPADCKEYGAGFHPHMGMQTIRPLTEDMWVRGIGPGHRYHGRCVTPNPGGREWWEISEAIKGLNIEVLEREVRRSTQFEPPIPTGFGARAKFNQPGRQQPVRKAPLRGGDTIDEWDWVYTPIEGCRYCGDDRHETSGCELMQLHRDKAIIQCLNCQGSGHFLRDCMNLPKFNDLDTRARKMQVYAHTEHWRRTLHEQHTKFAALGGVDNYPPLTDGKGDPSVAFSWLDCPNCTPEGHWDRFREVMKNSRWQFKDLDEHKDDVTRHWEHPLWLFIYDMCPVIWSVMHRENPHLVLHFINPTNSVAVDAFWRMTMKAMGWDAPDLPDGTTV
jgi:hypothetical protein